MHQEAERKLAEANLGKSAFLEAVDHLIRTPLSSALGATQLLDNHPDTTKKQQSMLALIIESAKEITWTLDRIRYYLDLD